jgi:crotonobetainyl-CoA:carnitine CoA-transferase CaiB-like acyl-CoA transferase
MTMALEGVRVLDLSRTPPGQYASMLLADFGADVLMIEVPPGAVARFDVRGAPETAEEARALAHNALRRNKRATAVNLRDDDGRKLFRRLVEGCDVVIDGFRPGVTARLGIDYASLEAVNPRVITCSVSGYGRTGPYQPLAGHDVNYISVGGALGAIGDERGKPVMPLNVVADYAGGGLMAAFSIVLALQARERTGHGQDVDLAMSDGVTSLMAQHISTMLGGAGPPRRGDHALAGSRCYYNVYECADGEWISVGAIEPYFFEALCNALGFEDFIPHQNDEQRQAEMYAAFAERFRTRPREEWFAELGELDACLTPVLGLDEVIDDPHVRAREMAIEIDGGDAGRVTQVGVAPKLLGTPGAVRLAPAHFGQHTDEVLAELGEPPERIAELRRRGVVA